MSRILFSLGFEDLCFVQGRPTRKRIDFEVSRTFDTKETEGNISIDVVNEL